MVLEYIECSATVMWLWWSCNAYFSQSLYDIYAKNGIASIKLYNMVMCGGDGPVMTKMRNFLLVLTRNNGSLMLYYLIVRVNCPYIKYKCS